MNRTPSDLSLQIVACFYPPTTTTTIGTSPSSTLLTTPTPSTTGSTTPLTTPTPSTTTTTLPPTTTTMNYCVEENGMNQPLSISPQQVTSSPPNDQNTPLNNINPTQTSPGLDFPSPNPQINVTTDQPASLTVIYIPTDIPNQPTTVEQFTVTFVFPNGTTSQTFPSTTPSSTTTTTTTTPSSSTGVAGATTTTPSATSIVPPSGASPQVDLPPNFQVPQNTTIVIQITSTINDSPATGVRIILLLFGISIGGREKCFSYISVFCMEKVIILVLNLCHRNIF